MQDVSFEAVAVGVVERLDRGVLHSAVHPFGLTVGPQVIGFGQLVRVVAATAFRQVGEGHAVVGQHGVDGIGERADDAARGLSSAKRSSLMSIWT